MLIFVELLIGRKDGTLNFEPSKSHTICVSLTHDIVEHSHLFMSDVLIGESKVLGFQSRVDRDYDVSEGLQNILAQKAYI